MLSNHNHSSCHGHCQGLPDIVKPTVLNNDFPVWLVSGINLYRLRKYHNALLSTLSHCRFQGRVHNCKRTLTAVKKFYSTSPGGSASLRQDWKFATIAAIETISKNINCPVGVKNFVVWS
jgi:hypothetical protein